MVYPTIRKFLVGGLLGKKMQAKLFTFRRYMGTLPSYMVED